MGRSRSATLIIMYIMFKFDVKLAIALDMVKQRRYVVDPNKGFMEQLKNFEDKMASG
jgi:protein-tyrosine phosphatase